ncbi:hypothetical protein SAMN05216252_11138 [Actinacidiphila glaucinigra]|uniref:Uncharacterized protein n=1 Tax=Actinacidiphila glaucinigra TaxID=235986 RepID=A0A239IRB8_9ACTN|nr:hypothetical protein SAMN05216252_11138 [Actinacidiphila glaucinigra]
MWDTGPGVVLPPVPGAPVVVRAGRHNAKATLAMLPADYGVYRKRILSVG